MNNEERRKMAIRLIEQHKARAFGSNELECMIREAYDYAIDALEKQVPKKPKLYEDKYYMCDCGECLAYKYEADGGLPFCLGCGQAIDWSDEK